jgi:hypothetical protein
METAHRNGCNQGLQNIRLYFLFKSERLNINIKSALHKAHIRSVTTYDYLIWEFAAESHLLKLLR